MRRLETIPTVQPLSAPLGGAIFCPRHEALFQTVARERVFHDFLA